MHIRWVATWLAIAGPLWAAAMESGVVPATHEEPETVPVEIVAPGESPYRSAVPQHQEVPAVQSGGSGVAAASDDTTPRQREILEALRQDQPTILPNTSLEDFAKVVQRATRKTFLWAQVDGLPGVTFDLHSSRQLTDPAELFELFQAICHMLGFAVVEVPTPTDGDPGVQRIYEIRKRENIRGLVPRRIVVYEEDQEQPPQIPETSEVMVLNYRLEHITAQDAQAALQGVVGPNFENYVLPLVTSNRIMIMDTGHNLRRIFGILRSLDVVPREPEFEVIPLRNANVADLVPVLQTFIQQLTQILQPAAAVAQRPPVAAIPAPAAPPGPPGQVLQAAAGTARIVVQADTRTNSLIVFADERNRERIRRLVEQLDVPAARLVQVHVRKLRHTFVSDVLMTLRAFLGDDRVREGARLEERPAVAEGGTGVGGGPPTRPIGGPPPTGGLFQIPLPQDQVQAPQPGGPDPFRVRAFAPLVVGDEPTNTIIVLADPDSYQYVDQLLSRLDVRRPQVYMKAHIVEVQANEDFDLGVELARLKNARPGSVEWGLATQLGLTEIVVDPEEGIAQVPVPLPGLFMAIFKDRVTNIPFILRAFQRVVSVRVLEEPEVVVRDNELAEIAVSQQVPYFQTVFTGTSPVVNFAGFLEAPTRLTIAPRITDPDSINLEISLEVSRFIGTGDPARGVPPPKFTRRMSSSITVPDGHTAAIGGLITGDETETVAGVPVLKEVPILGFFFRREMEAQRKTVMYIFVTPTILTDYRFSDMRQETHRRMDEQESYGQRSERMARWPPPEPPVRSGFDPMPQGRPRR